jgi:hypothetical protein
MVSRRITTQRRSTLGSHWAGTGIVGQSAQDFDDHIVKRVAQRRKVSYPTPDTKEEKKKFDAYCKEMSGDVEVYNIKDLEEAPE